MENKQQKKKHLGVYCKGTPAPHFRPFDIKAGRPFGQKTGGGREEEETELKQY